MQQLTNLDASFLHLESSRTPMHIGCVLSFSAPVSGEMTFERFKCFIKARLSISPVFRRRISTHIFNMDQPVWVEAADFNIDQHVFEKVLDRGWHKHQINELINQFFSKTLDHKRPLWEMLFFKDEENSNEQFHVLLKFHHAAVDGMSAEKILSGLLSPEKEDQNELDDSWMPASLPLSNKIYDITGKQLRNIYESPNKLLHLIRRLGHSAFSSQALRFLDKEQCPPHFFTAPETPFNQDITSQHDLASTHLSLDKIKAIRKAYPGSTINDVVLAICSGALRTHLNKQGKLPEQALVAMIPVSKRPKEQTTNGDNTNGNLISPMLVSLATDLDTATARLGMIHQNTMVAKKFNQRVALERIMNHLPSWSSALTIKAFTQLRLARYINPVFNLIITNVPGPKTPLYLDGAELLSIQGMAPIVDGMGLTMVVTSYINTLTISLTSCASMAKQTRQLVSCFDTALEELYEDLIEQDIVMPLAAV